MDNFILLKLCTSKHILVCNRPQSFSLGYQNFKLSPEKFLIIFISVHVNNYLVFKVIHITHAA